MITGEKINGAKIRCVQRPDGFWTLMEDCQFYSRTFMPTGTKFIEAQDETELFTKIKKENDIKFKDSDLSKEMKDKFKGEKIEDKIDKNK